MKDSVIIDSAPIGRWMIGKKIDYVQQWVQSKRGTMEQVKDTSVIPEGEYCYGENGICPYWSLNKSKPKQMNGYCSYLEYGDWEVEIPEDFPEGFPQSCLSLLWDQCKECDINMGDIDEGLDR